MSWRARQVGADPMISRISLLHEKARRSFTEATVKIENVLCQKRLRMNVATEGCGRILGKICPIRAPNVLG